LPKDIPTTVTVTADDPSLQATPIHFIVGMSRAGTTWMMTTLGRHPDVVSFGETCYWGRLYIAPQNGETYSIGELQKLSDSFQLRSGAMYSSIALGPKPALCSAEEFQQCLLQSLTVTPATPASVFRQLCTNVANACGRRVVVEKTPHHINWLDRIAEAFPHAKFIVMARDGYGFLNSYKHQGDRKPEVVRRSFRRLYHPIACALIYRKYVHSIMAAKKTYADRVQIFQTSDIGCDPEGVVGRVLKLLLLPGGNVAVEAKLVNSSFDGASRVPCSCAEKFWINFVAGRKMSELGFERQRAGVCPGQVLLTLISLIPWAVRNVVTLRRSTHQSTFSYLRAWLSR